MTADRSQALRRAMTALPGAQALNAMIWSIPNPPSVAKARAGDSKPLAGVPIVVKDNIDVAGLATTAGSPGLIDNRAVRDAPVIRQLKAAGAVVVGKTNLHELAFGATSINPTFGTVLNPHNTRFTAGGSSGGSAAAVAIGAALLGVGTDTAGSSRVPASCCGVVGFRPSFDRYPLDGIVPISWNRDTVGLIARDVELIIKVDAVLAGESAAPGTRSGSIRLGIPLGMAEGISADVATLFQAALDVFHRSGVHVELHEILGRPERLWRIHAPIVEFDMPQHLGIFLRRRASDIRLENVAERVADPLVKSRLKSMIAGEGARSLKRQKNGLTLSSMLRDKVTSLLHRNGLDGLFYPTMMTQAAGTDDRETICIGVREHRVGPALLRNTLLASLAGLPSVSLPIGVSQTGVPVGALFEGRPGQDASVLQVAAELQAILRNGYGEVRHV